MTQCVPALLCPSHCLSWPGPARPSLSLPPLRRGHPASSPQTGEPLSPLGQAGRSSRGPLEGGRARPESRRYLVDWGKGRPWGLVEFRFFSKWKFLPPPPSREKVKEGTWAAGKSCRGGDCGFRGRTVCGTGQGEVRRVGLFREVVGGRGPKLAPSLLTGEPSPPFSAPRVGLQAPVRMEQWCGGPTKPALG